MNYSSAEIGKILDLSHQKDFIHLTIEEVSIDSRTIISPNKALFFALPGGMNDGHNYIGAAYDRGVRNFVVNQVEIATKYPEANFFIVDNVLSSLQNLATYHRKSFPNLKNIGITGSNGKTIIKEWLYQMLYDELNIVKSPKSYNSQIGMALSILGIDRDHELGIFEAGISKMGEMENHLLMLSPKIGLLTNIGSAHDEGFSAWQEKLIEKLILFRNAKVIIYRSENTEIKSHIESQYNDKEQFTWGVSSDSNVQVLSNKIVGANRLIAISYRGQAIEIKLRFSDLASFENLMHCIAIMCYLGIPLNEIEHRVDRISGLHMRMEMTTGIHKSIIINDAYSADLDALQIALEFVNQQAGKREKLAILSAFDQSGKDEEYVFDKILEHLISYGFSDLIYLSKNKISFNSQAIYVNFYTSKEELLADIKAIDIAQKIVLIKGARQYELEDVSDRLSEKGHSATLQINLNALEHNLRIYKNYLNKQVEIISVVKASAYGSGLSEIARLLEQNGVNYLAVAFVDEGIALRQAGIDAKIIVFNPDLTSLPDLIRYRLEPEVYDLHQMDQIVNYSIQNKMAIDIHLKLDTGMHRLGFLENDITDLCKLLKSAKKIKVRTIFSHLASSEDESDDDYSQKQFDTFDEMYSQIAEAIQQKPKLHILNSGGITRFPDRQYDFVRLGIGMYGIDNNPVVRSKLRKVHRLNASLIQVKEMKAGDSIGYNRKTVLTTDKTIGIVNIGYADGVMRNLGNANYSFKIHEKDAEIVGNVCMDVTIVDLSNVTEAKIGDQVTIFDESNSIENLAAAAGTIPYEILSRISTRVNRKFVRE